MTIPVNALAAFNRRPESNVRENVMRLMPYAFCLAALLVSAASVSAAPAYVAGTLNLRAAPGTQSEIVAKIPGGSLVDAAECSEGWCAVTWQGKSGFAIQRSLDMSGRVPQRQAARPDARRSYEADAGYVPEEYIAEGPVYYEAPPRYYGYYGYGPYYRPWGWRRHWW